MTRRERFAKWWVEVASPALVGAARSFGETMDQWWGDIGDKPRSHFVSMIFALLIFHAVKIAVWVAA